MNILHIDSSINEDRSVSRALTNAVVERLKIVHPSASYTYRDLVEHPLRHYTAAARRYPSVSLNEKQHMEVSVSKELVGELRWADVVVLGAPMYNLGISSQLKSWIDHVVVPGVTFGFGPEGPVNLLGDKRIIAVSTRGMEFGPGSPWERFDYQENFLRDLFLFLGIANFTVIRAEGVSAPATRHAVVQNAYRQIAQLS